MTFLVLTDHIGTQSHKTLNIFHVDQFITVLKYKILINTIQNDLTIHQ